MESLRVVVFVSVGLLVFRADFYIVLQHCALVAAQECLRVELEMLSSCLGCLGLPNLLGAIRVGLSIGLLLEGG